MSSLRSLLATLLLPLLVSARSGNTQHLRGRGQLTAGAHSEAGVRQAASALRSAVHSEVSRSWPAFLAGGPSAFAAFPRPLLDDNLVVAFSEPVFDDDVEFVAPAAPHPLTFPSFPTDGPDQVWVAVPVANLAPPAGLVRQMAGEFADSEVFKRAAQHANVTSWSSKEVMDANGTVHRFVTTCKADNCTTTEEKVQLPMRGAQRGNASVAGGKAQNASNLVEQQELPEAMRGFAGELGRVRSQLFEPGEFDDMLGNVLGDFGLSAPEPLELPRLEGKQGSNVTQANSYSESSEVYVKDGKLHQKITKCDGDKCTTKERTEDIKPGSAASKPSDVAPKAKNNTIF